MEADDTPTSPPTSPPDAAGRLVVVGTPIGNLGDLSPRGADALRDADILYAEDTRHTGRLLAHLGVDTPMRSSHEHNEHARVDEVVARIVAGEVVALVSDAGMPGVSDPGQVLVEGVVAAGLDVEVVPGPTAVTTALVASALPSARFVFEGFLPRKGPERRARLDAVAVEDRTVVLYVSPHRVADDVAALREVCGDDRPVALARELTKFHEEVVRTTFGALAERVAGGVRGEVVLVVGPGAPRTAAPVDDEQLRREVDELLDKGHRRKDAAEVVAHRHGLRRNEVYERTLSR